MEISFLGHSSFKIRGKTSSVVTDPYDPEMVGLSFAKVQADVVTISHDHQDHNQKARVSGNPKVISGPGEYEIGGVSIFGIPSFHDAKQGQERGKNTIYVLTIDGLTVCHLGDLGHKLSEETLAEIGNVDILLVPVGGVYTIGPQEAGEAVSAIEPSVVIPMHYKMKGMNEEVFGKLASVDDFTRELGITPVEESRYNISRESLPQEMQVVVLASP